MFIPVNSISQESLEFCDLGSIPDL